MRLGSKGNPQNGTPIIDLIAFSSENFNAQKCIYFHIYIYIHIHIIYFILRNNIYSNLQILDE